MHHFVLFKPPVAGHLRKVKACRPLHSTRNPIARTGRHLHSSSCFCPKYAWRNLSHTQWLWCVAGNLRLSSDSPYIKFPSKPTPTVVLLLLDHSSFLSVLPSRASWSRLTLSGAYSNSERSFPSLCQATRGRETRTLQACVTKARVVHVKLIKMEAAPVPTTTTNLSYFE